MCQAVLLKETSRSSRQTHRNWSEHGRRAHVTHWRKHEEGGRFGKKKKERKKRKCNDDWISTGADTLSLWRQEVLWTLQRFNLQGKAFEQGLLRQQSLKMNQRGHLQKCSTIWQRRVSDVTGVTFLCEGKKKNCECNGLLSLEDDQWTYRYRRACAMSASHVCYDLAQVAHFLYL